MMDKEISSTEKLLDFIRTEIPTAPGIADQKARAEAAAKHSSDKIQRSLRYLVPWQARYTIGVDIGINAIRLVKMTSGDEGSRRLLDYRTVTIFPEVAGDGPEFAELLAGALRDFCGAGATTEIWAALPTANAEIRSLLVPKVPAKQLPNTISWFAKKEGISLDEGEYVFDYQVHQGEFYHEGQPRHSVTAYALLRKEVEEKKRLFTRAGWPLTGITIVPFAIQNLLGAGRIQSRGESMACLFIGNDFSRIDIFFRGNLLMTRGIKAGAESLVEALVDGYREKNSGRPEEGGELCFPHLGEEDARKILENFCSANPLMAGVTVDCNLKEEDVLSLIIPAIGRIVGQVERTFEYFTVSKRQSRVQCLYCSGVMGTEGLFFNYLQEQFAGVAVHPLDFSFTRRGRIDFDEISTAERVSYTTALGLALAGNGHTPNAIFTHRDKTAVENTVWVNKTIFASFLASITVCTVIFIYLGKSLEESRAMEAALKKEVHGFNRPLDVELINRQLAEFQGRSQRLKAYSRRYLGLAAIGELSNLTPPEIRLLNVTAKFEKDAAAGKTVDNARPDRGQVMLEGIVGSTSRAAEVTLAEYALKLDQSPLFRQASVESSSPEVVGGNKVLHFKITMKIE